MSFLGAIGGALISGIFGSKQQKSAQAFEQNRIGMTVREAKKHGIHPLAALGQASAYQNPFMGNPVGDALASGIAGADAAYEQKKAEEAAKPLQDKRIELLDAQIAESRSRTLLNAGNAKRALVGNQGHLGTVGGLEALDNVVTPNGVVKRPVEVDPSKNVPMRQHVVIGDKQVVGINPEATEGQSIGELLGAAMIYGPQLYGQWLRSLPKKKNSHWNKGRKK